MFSFFESFVNPFPKKNFGIPPKTLFGFIRHYSQGCEKYFFLMALLTGTIAALEVSLYGGLGSLIDWFNTRADKTLDSAGKTILFKVAIVLLLLPFFVLVHSLLVHQSLIGNFAMRIRWQSHQHLLKQSYSFYQNEFAGRLATKVMQTAVSTREAAMKVLDVMLYVAIYFGSIVVLALTLDPKLAIPLVIWLGIYISILRFFLPRLSHFSAKQANARSEMTGRIVDTYTNIATVKLFSHSQRELDYTKDGMTRFLKTVYPQMRLVTQLSVAVWLNNIILTVLTGGLGLYLWQGDWVSSGALAAVIALVLRLFGMSQWIMWEVSSIFEHLGATRDGMNTLTHPQSVQDCALAQPMRVTQGEICFHKVGFHYGKGHGVIENLSLTIKAGEKIGLVGRSGAGKSTLVNLLLRFHDLERGHITIDHQDVSKVNQESLRGHIGVVTQDTSLLHRSVRENLLYGRPNASFEEIIQAAKQAKAHDFILGLDDNNGNTGYDAKVGERGVKLSGGQRQRIAIARVLLKDAPILVMDEATSALDSEVEAAIQENLYTLMEGKTVIAIAHRLSTIAALDRLIVLDEGNVVEQGNHEQLIQKGGLYAQLWAHQSGGFLG